MAQKTGAQYLESSTKIKRSKRSKVGPFFAAISAISALVVAMFAGGLAISQHSATVASAVAGDLCGTIGLNMDGRASWVPSGSLALPNLSDRRFTLSEITQNSLFWTNFTGGGKGSGWLSGDFDAAAIEANQGRTSATALPMSADLPSELQNSRSWSNCLFTSGISQVGSIGLMFANTVSGFTSWIATTSFNASFICPADGSVTDGCIDIVKVIGGRTNDASSGGTGEGANSGIIGTLTTGIYKPLVIFVMLITAMLIFWTGIVKRKFREALGQLIWFAASFVIGLALLLNPALLVRAPMIATNTILGCVVGSFDGSGCVGGGAASPEISNNTTAKSNICISDSSLATPQERTTLYVNSMGCSIWSAFVLEPYTRAAFGVGVSGLDLDSVLDPSTGQTVRSLLSSNGWSVGQGKDVPGDPNDICVNLSTSESFNSMKGSTFTGGTGNQVCNLAVWELFMKTNATGGQVTSASNNPDASWYNVLSRMPANATLWNNYSNFNGSSSLGKIGYGALASFTAVIGSVIIILTSVSSLVYYVIAVLMLAFAPIFFLLGLHPGRGKRMMLGWLEQIVSNMLKYLVSAVFLLIVITFYGAILGSSGDIGTTMLFVVLISMALFMYRKELIGILGRVNMGGEKMADFADQALRRGAAGVQKYGTDPIKKYSKATVAGAAAGMITHQGIGTGVNASVMRELRQGNGFAARVTQAASQISTDVKNDKSREQEDVSQQAAALEEAATEKEIYAKEAVEAARPYAQNAAEAAEDLKTRQVEEDDNKENYNLAADLAQGTLEISLTTDWAEKNQPVANAYQEIQRAELESEHHKVSAVRLEAQGRLDDAKIEIELSQKQSQKAADLKNQFVEEHGEHKYVEAAYNFADSENGFISTVEDNELRAQYEKLTELDREFGFGSYADRYADSIRATQESSRNSAQAQSEWDQVASELQAAAADASSTRSDAEAVRARSDSMLKDIKDFKAGEIITKKKIQKLDKNAADAGVNAAGEYSEILPDLKDSLEYLKNQAETEGLKPDVRIESEEARRMQLNHLASRKEVRKANKENKKKSS